MKEKLLELKTKALEDLKKINDVSGLEEFRIRYLGKKGLLSALMKNIGKLPPEDVPQVGKIANEVREEITKQYEDLKKKLQQKEKKERFIDVTLPGRSPERGHIHPITTVIKEVCDIFSKMGFRVVTGPEVELDYYNFEALNIPKDHPARDMQDTFYITENLLLRTHTSPIQVRVMEVQKPPVAIICPGKVYRRDSDVSHTPMFHQVEGLLVDRSVTFGDLKGVLTLFVHKMFGKDTKLRFRPSFFPFTEPSAEVDIQCVICKGKGCRTCGFTGWLEILGSGMVDPEVYRFVGYDQEKYTGFAFGMGIERIAMLKYGIEDIQMFYKNEMRFLGQF